MYYNIFDSHSHSENSPDGHHSVTFMAETAIAGGVQGIAITDHCEGDVFEKSNAEKRISQSALDTAMAKTAFGNNLILTLGIEIGQPLYNRIAVESLLEKHNFDFVLGSIHVLAYEGFDFFRADYNKISAQKLDEYIFKYYEELIELIKWGGFDVIGHLSFPIRYPKHFCNIDIDLKRYREPIDEVLKLAAQTGKGIELNMSGLRYNMNVTMPPAWALKRFRELGGEIVTIGSDAHKVKNLGNGIELGMQMLADAGYNYFAFYKGRKPVMLRII